MICTDCIHEFNGYKECFGCDYGSHFESVIRGCSTCTSNDSCDIITVDHNCKYWKPDLEIIDNLKNKDT